MNRLRHLQAKHVIGRWISHLILSVLALRLLLPTGLMLDPSTEGDSSGLGLVICSGQGPLPIHTLVTTNGTNFTVDETTVSARDYETSLHDHSLTAPVKVDDLHPSGHASNAICPFSAAFMNALIAFAVFLVFCHFTALIVARYRRQSFVFVQRLFRSSHSARAPPMFC